MSDSVENKIVSIQFDNSAFQSKMNETIKSLDNLRKSLDFSASKKGLNDLSASANKFSLANIGANVESIASKFSAMGLIAVGALTRIGSEAVAAGGRMLKSFTFGPIMDGFREFETNMNSIQTILANTSSKGTTLAEVNDALNVLNKYSDKTIYNFTEMARNIGTFTAAGIALKPATQAIKGIANLAAVSGSNADQASTAMYQLSQAMASGSVKLMDWNSVVNAGMGGEVFQKSLFETGKALKTLKNIPMGQTFEEWKKQNGSFRESLKDGWITTDVLTTTLAGFTGEMSKNELVAKGFTEKQATEIIRMGKVAENAATQVKTFTQLVSTVKEAIGSGWTQTFQILLGNFDEAKTLFTGINNTIGKFVNQSANARNSMLQQWKDLGGRTKLIEAFKNVFKSLGQIFNTIRKAFQDIFPPMTAKRLLELTKGFLEFTKHLKMGGETLKTLRSIFRGFFAALSIGWTIVKEIFGLIGRVISALAPAGSQLLGFGASAGDMMTRLQKALVAGGGIHDFFVKLGNVIVAPIKFLEQLGKKIQAFFTEDISKDNRITSRLDQISSTAQKVGNVWDRLLDRFGKIKDALSGVWDYIANWFGELGQKIADAFKPGDFDAAVDIINVGLIGGIAVLLRKFVKGGLKLDFGGGLLDKIKGSFDQLTKTLKQMQTNLKADALKKIAVSVGILVASIVALSLIDSAALTKALAGLTVSFGELIGAMTLLDRLNFKSSILKLNGIAAGMILMSTAAVILSGAIAILSRLDWSELAKGLTGIAGAMVVLVGATRLIGGNAPQLIAAGVAMIAMATALNILAAAVKLFSLIDMGSMMKGLLGVALGLTAITAALNLMPASGAISGIGFIEIAIGLNLLAGAVKLFGMMNLEEMGQGLIGITLALLGIAGAMNLMPITLPVTAAGVLVLSVALGIMAKAVESMGKNDLGTLARGIGAFAVMLGILAGAMALMTASVSGAVALITIAGAMSIFAKVIKTFGAMDISEIAIGLGALAAVFLVLGLAAFALEGVTPALLALGIALGVVGGAFALFGVGVMLVAKGFEILAKSGSAGAKAFVEMLKIISTSAGDMAEALANVAIHFIEDILHSMPLLIRLVEALLDQLLVTIIKETPKIAKAIAVIVTEGLKLLRAKFPDLVKTGFEMMISLLKGIKDNIKEITILAVEIVVEFINGLIKKTPDLVTAAVGLIVAFIAEIGKHAEELVSAGASALASFLEGIANNVGMVVEAVFDIITSFITAVGSNVNRIVTTGANVMISFIQGLGSNTLRIVNAAGQAIVDFLNGLADAINKYAPQIQQAGLRVILAVISGMTFGLSTKLGEVISWFAGLGGKVVGWVGDVARKLWQKGIDFISGLLGGLKEAFLNVWFWVIHIPQTILDWFVDAGTWLFDIGKDIMQGLWDGMKDIWDNITGWLGNLDPRNSFNDINPRKGHAIKNLVSTGADVMTGLRNGMETEWKNTTIWLSSLNPANEMDLTGIKTTLGKLNDLSNMKEFNPVITPVLDLTKVQSEASKISGYIQTGSLSASSYLQARTIAAGINANKQEVTETTPNTGPTEIKFEQIINSPTRLSASDIYKQTRNQISLAKEELKIS